MAFIRFIGNQNLIENDGTLTKFLSDEEMRVKKNYQKRIEAKKIETEKREMRKASNKGYFKTINRLRGFTMKVLQSEILAEAFDHSKKLTF